MNPSGDNGLQRFEHGMTLTHLGRLPRADELRVSCTWGDPTAVFTAVQRLNLRPSSVNGGSIESSAGVARAEPRRVAYC